MKKVSELDMNRTVEELLESELGFILLEADVKNVYDILSEQSTWEDRLGMYADNHHITYHLFPLFYKGNCGLCEKRLVDSRMNAVHNIFMMWCNAGYNKNHAKSPFSSKCFQKFLKEIEFEKADYLLLMVS